VQSLSATLAHWEHLAHDGEADLREMSAEERGELLASLPAALRVADLVAAMIDRTRTCAGCYWRDDPVVRARIDGRGEQRGTKKRKVKRLTSQCSATTKTGMAAAFAREATGPPRTDHGPRSICDACGQQFAKDRRSGFVSGK